MVSPRLVLTRALEHGLFAGLTLPKKIEVCEVLLTTGAPDLDAVCAIKQGRSIIIFLTSYCHSIRIVKKFFLALYRMCLSWCTSSDLFNPKRRMVLHGRKKPNLRSMFLLPFLYCFQPHALMFSAPEDDLPALSLFVEVLGTKPLPGSLDLISRLLETLNRVVQSASSTSADMSYIEQLLMSAVENAAEKVLVRRNWMLWIAILIDFLSRRRLTSALVLSVWTYSWNLYEVRIQNKPHKSAFLTVCSSQSQIIHRPSTKLCCSWQVWLVWRRIRSYTMSCLYLPSWGLMSSTAMTLIASGLYKR